MPLRFTKKPKKPKTPEELKGSGGSGAKGTRGSEEKKPKPSSSTPKSPGSSAPKSPGSSAQKTSGSSAPKPGPSTPDPSTPLRPKPAFPQVSGVELLEGRRVKVWFSDGIWYGGNVSGVEADGKINVLFDDEDSTTVDPSNQEDKDEVRCVLSDEELTETLAKVVKGLSVMLKCYILEEKPMVKALERITEIFTVKKTDARRSERNKVEHEITEEEEVEKRMILLHKALVDEGKAVEEKKWLKLMTDMRKCLGGRYKDPEAIVKKRLEPEEPEDEDARRQTRSKIVDETPQLVSPSRGKEAKDLKARGSQDPKDPKARGSQGPEKRVPGRLSFGESGEGVKERAGGRRSEEGERPGAEGPGAEERKARLKRLESARESREQGLKSPRDPKPQEAKKFKAKEPEGQGAKDVGMQDAEGSEKKKGEDGKTLSLKGAGGKAKDLEAGGGKRVKEPSDAGEAAGSSKRKSLDGSQDPKPLSPRGDKKNKEQKGKGEKADLSKLNGQKPKPELPAAGSKRAAAAEAEATPQACKKKRALPPIKLEPNKVDVQVLPGDAGVKARLKATKWNKDDPSLKWSVLMKADIVRSRLRIEEHFFHDDGEQQWTSLHAVSAWLSTRPDIDKSQYAIVSALKDIAFDRLKRLETVASLKGQTGQYQEEEEGPAQTGLKGALFGGMEAGSSFIVRRREGRTCGVGLQVEYNEEKQNVVVSSIEWWADKLLWGRVRKGDVVSAVDLFLCEGKPVQEVMEHLQGPNGSFVRVEFIRGKEKFRTLLARRESPIPMGWLPRLQPPTHRAKVLVIGAGASGLAAARRLAEKGLDVTILEARDRTGGRIHTMAFKGDEAMPATFVDLGASYVHGCDGRINPVFELAKDCGALIDPSEGGYGIAWGEFAPWFDHEKGGRVPQKLVKRAFAIMWNVWTKLKARVRMERVPKIQCFKCRQWRALPLQAAEGLRGNKKWVCDEATWITTNDFQFKAFQGKACEVPQHEWQPHSPDDTNLLEAYHEALEQVHNDYFRQYNAKKTLAPAEEKILNASTVVAWAYVARMEQLALSHSAKPEDEVDLEFIPAAPQDSQHPTSPRPVWQGSKAASVSQSKQQAVAKDRSCNLSFLLNDDERKEAEQAKQQQQEEEKAYDFSDIFGASRKQPSDESNGADQKSVASTESMHVASERSGAILTMTAEEECKESSSTKLTQSAEPESDDQPQPEPSMNGGAQSHNSGLEELANTPAMEQGASQNPGAHATVETPLVTIKTEVEQSSEMETEQVPATKVGDDTEMVDAHVETTIDTVSNGVNGLSSGEPASSNVEVKVEESAVPAQQPSPSFAMSKPADQNGATEQSNGGTEEMAEAAIGAYSQSNGSGNVVVVKPIAEQPPQNSQTAPKPPVAMKDANPPGSQPKPPSYTPGMRCEVKRDGDWWRCTVQEVDEKKGEVELKYWGGKVDLRVSERIDSSKLRIAREDSWVKDDDRSDLDLHDGMVVDGYSNFLIKLLEQDLDIKLQRKVTSISIDTDPEADGRPCRVRMMKPSRKTGRWEDAGELGADYVICTLPVGVLQDAVGRGTIKFRPSLPKDKVDAINSLGMGKENKVIMRFKTRFWPDEIPYFNSTEISLRFINGHYFGKVHTLIAHLSPQLNYFEWSDEKIETFVLEVLTKMFDLEESPQPVDSHVTRWDKDEFARGSYSFMAKGSNAQHVTALAKPCHNDRLLFAGEACSHDGVQCVHGAYTSGKEAAHHVLVCEGISSDDD